MLATVAASVLADPIEIDPMRVRAPHLHTTFAFSRETAALEPQPLLFLDLISSGGDCWFRFGPERVHSLGNFKVLLLFHSFFQFR